MTTTDRMVAWLRDAMDTAQQRAEAAAAETGSTHWEYRDDYRLHAAGSPGFTVADVDYRDPAPGKFMAANDPAAVLRRITTDRKILEAHPTTTEIINPGYGKHVADFGCVTCHDWDGVTEGHGWCPTVRLLAEGYGWTDETT